MIRETKNFVNSTPNLSQMGLSWLHSPCRCSRLISLVESRAKVVGKDLEEINGRFDCHRDEINRLKIREKDSKEEVEKLKGFIVCAGHEAQVFKNCLDRMEENVCRCGWTPSEVGEEFVSSEDEVGWSCPMHLSERTSMLLLLWRTLFPSQFLLRPLAALGPPLLFLPWKRSLKNPPSSVRCQGCSLRLTGTRGLVGEGGVEGVVYAFGS